METKIKTTEPTCKNATIVKGDSRNSWINSWFDWNNEEIK